MPDCYELVDSQSGAITKEMGQAESLEKRLHFVIGKCNSFDEAVDDIRPYAPAYISCRGKLLMRTQTQINGVGRGYYDVSANYQSMTSSDEGGDEGGGNDPQPGSVSWDTAGGRDHITQAYHTDKFPDDAPDFSDAVNVSGDSVNGVDVVAKSMKYSETWVVPLSVAMSQGFVSAIYTLTGTVNADAFRAFAPGEALFLGAKGQWQEDQPFVAVTFDFECRANDTQWYPLPGYGSTETKKGWEYVWYRYGASFDGGIVQRPVAAYKCRVYKEASWSGLQVVDKDIGKGRNAIKERAATAAAVKAFLSGGL